MDRREADEIELQEEQLYALQLLQELPDKYKTVPYIEGNLMDQVKQTRLLGIIISSDLTWHANTANIVHRCYQRMVILRKLYGFSIPVVDMVHIYTMYIRSVAEQSSVVWSSDLTRGEEYDLERIQKVALRIILAELEDYTDYESALVISKLQTLKARRTQLRLRFAVKCTKTDRAKDMFPVNNQNGVNLRYPEKYEVTMASTGRLANSAIPTMQRQLNKHARS